MRRLCSRRLVPQKFFSFEFFPPKTDEGLENLWERMDLMVQQQVTRRRQNSAKAPRPFPDGGGLGEPRCGRELPRILLGKQRRRNAASRCLGGLRNASHARAVAFGSLLRRL